MRHLGLLGTMTLYVIGPAFGQGDPGAGDALPAVLRPRAEGRMKVRDRRVTDAIAGGLDWLCAHQDEDGRWDADGFMKHDVAGTATDGKGYDVHDVGVTGLALLALLAEGSVHAEAVERGTDWLRKQQDAGSGLFTSNASDFVYGHAVATLAVLEAYGVLGRQKLRDSAREGLRYLESHRSPGGGWGYQLVEGPSDTSIIGWCLAAYSMAEHLGIETNPETVIAALVWLDGVTKPTTGECGYRERGEVSARHSHQHGRKFPPDKGAALTASALFTRLLAGRSPDDPILEAAAERLLEKPPLWGAATTDYYYWYYATQALAHVGGKGWQTWREQVAAVLAGHQRHDGDFAGSWDPLSVWGSVGGRIYATAMAVLTLQAAYRYGDFSPGTRIPGGEAFTGIRVAWRQRRFGQVAAGIDELVAADPDDALRGGIRTVRRLLAFEEELARATVAGMLARKDYAAAMDLLTVIRKEFAGLELGKEASRHLARCRSDQEIRRELDAHKALANLRRRYDVGNERHWGPFKAALRKMRAKYSGTVAASEALRIIKSLTE